MVCSKIGTDPLLKGAAGLNAAFPMRKEAQLERYPTDKFVKRLSQLAISDTEIENEGPPQPRLPLEKFFSPGVLEGIARLHQPTLEEVHF